VTALIASSQFHRLAGPDGFVDDGDDFQVVQEWGNAGRLHTAAAFAQKRIEKFFRGGNNFPFRCD
jgi:hypothetical protein